MTDLESILAAGENDTVEFKTTFNQDVIQTAAAFANTRGGYIAIGISNSGKRTGNAFSAEALRDCVNRISNSTQPAVIPDAELHDHSEGQVLVLSIPEYPLKPVSVRGRCYLRSGSVTRQMTAPEITELHLQSTGQSPDAQWVAGKTADDLDPALVKRYMTRAVNSGRRRFSVNDDPLEILMKLELIRSPDEISLAALLMFGKAPQTPFSQAVIRAGRIRGKADIVDDVTLSGPLGVQVDSAMDFLRKHMRVEYVIGDSLERKEKWDYPLSALREGLMNAVCHRDYGDLAEIQIKFFDDSLQIWSPGFLPFGVTVEELLLPTHASKPRNRLISQVFYDMGMIERYGSGTVRILESCREAGLPSPDFDNFSGGFRILFRAKQTATPQAPRKHPASTPQVSPQVARLLTALSGDMSRDTLQQEMGLKDRMNFMRNYLDPAVAAGVVEPTEPDAPNSPTQKYRLTEKGAGVLSDEQ